MEKLKKDIYNTLTESGAELNKMQKELKETVGKIESGNFSAEYIKNYLEPQRIAKKEQIRAKKAGALHDAKELVRKYQKAEKSKDALNPDDITDDLKLLAPGIILTADDIYAMLDRNEDNATMQQIILRYADAHEIKTGRTYSGHKGNADAAENLIQVIDTCEKWLTDDRCEDVLTQFFF